MSDFDPLDLVSTSLDGPEQPDPDFGDRLLTDLLADFDDAEHSGGEALVLDLRQEREDDEAVADAPRTGRRVFRGILAAAVIALVVAAAVLLTGGDDEGYIDVTNLPEPSGRLDLATAELLLQNAGGVDALTVATVPSERRATLVTFDPLDTDRLLIGDINGGSASADLWLLSEDGSEAGVVPWLEEQQRFFQGGSFQPDGSILVASGTANEPKEVILLDNAGELVDIRAVAAPEEELAGISYLPSSQGEIAFTLRTGRLGCPYSSLVVADAEGVTVLDDRLRAFVRTSIPEPGIGMAFPFLGHDPSCDPPEANAAAAWDLETGEMLTDYPLHGLEIARAVVSGDGTRAVVMGPAGTVSVRSMESGEPIATLGNFDGRFILNPLAVNRDGSIAVVAEDSGRVTMWHVDSGALLLELQSDLSRMPPGALDIVGPGAGLAYDGSRVAILDDSTSTWRILTLDPAEWAALGCEADRGIRTADLEGRGVVEGAGC